FGYNDQLATLLAGIEHRNPSAGRHDGERHSLLGENLARPPVGFRQLHEITDWHQPLRQRRAERHTSATTKMRYRMSFSALLVLPGEPALSVILRCCYSGDIPDLHEFTILASARQLADGRRNIPP